MITSYEEMSVGIFMEVKDILMDKTTSELEKRVRLLAILNNKSEEEIMGIPISKLTSMVSSMEFLSQQPKTKTPPNEITLNGNVYEIKYDVQNITTAQYIDFQTFIKDYDKYMVELASIVIIPKGKKYNEGYDIVAVQRDIREYMSIVDLSSVCFFFVQLYKGLIQSLTSYSIRQMKKMMRREKNKVLKIKIGRTIVQMKQLMEEMPING